ncbi:ribose-5-phosphate isomerase A [Candidatus Vidania fulgoroideorum]
MNNLLFYNIFKNYIKSILKKNLVISFGKGHFINFLIEKFNFKSKKIKKIFVTTKEQEIILKKRKINFSNFHNTKNIDLHISFSNSINNFCFVNGYTGELLKEKFYFNNAKKKLIISNNKFTKPKTFPIEIFSKFINVIRYRIIKRYNLEILNKNIEIKDNLSTLIIKFNKKKKLPRLYNKIKKLSGVLEVGIYKKDKNTNYLIIKKNFIFLI